MASKDSLKGAGKIIWGGGESLWKLSRLPDAWLPPLQLAQGVTLETEGKLYASIRGSLLTFK